MDDFSDDEAPVVLPLGREFDLHTFRPRDITSVVAEYLIEARALGYEHVRIVHGKGIGFQRDAVRKILAETSFVVEYGDDPGNRGATWATLSLPAGDPPKVRA
jgi:dsDNA-specific endonuclease/ATPase MutS2